MSICYPPRPIFAKPTHPGLGRAQPGGDGVSVSLRWDPGYSPESDWLVGYNIYFSSSRDDVFKEGVKYFTLVTEIAVSQFIPGDTNYFAIRATLWNPVDMNSTGLTPALTATDAYVYPETILSTDITATDTQISVLDVTDFPTYGIIKIGGELIKYYFINSVTNTILTTPDGRGYFGTEARLHTVDGFDGYVQRDPTITYFLGYEDPNEIVVLAEPQFRPPHHAFNEIDGYKRQNEDLLTTDLEASDETNEDIPGYDYSGYHQTSMLDYFSGKCLGSYHGGEYGCANSTSNIYGDATQPGESRYNTKIRGFNLQDANMRREEMLLETTGEPVVLVRRKWTGIRCPCFRHNNQRPDARCPTCFIPGTLIRTITGYKPIDEISVGELVLTEDGNFNKVTNTMKTWFDGNLISVQNKASTKPLLVTPDHPFLTMCGHHSNLIKRNCGPKCNKYIENEYKEQKLDIEQLPSKRWHARTHIDGQRIVVGTFDTKEIAKRAIVEYRKNNVKQGHFINWKNASELNNNSWLACGWPSLETDMQKIQISKCCTKNTRLGMQRNGPNEFDINEEFMWIIDIYLAEGSSDKRSINFALHKKEIEFQNKIINFFEKFGYTTTLKQTGENGVAVYVYSTTLAQWFPYIMGRKCYNKKIPNEFMFLPKHKIEALIQGIYDGNGTKACNEITQTSEVLAMQLVELLHKIGEQPLLRHQRSNILTPNENKRRLAYCVNWRDNNPAVRNRKNRWNFKNERQLVKVSNIQKQKYQGYVYNLEVENNHTYIVNNIIVHNCFGTGFETGYDQYFNQRRSDRRILVRFDPTTDDLLQMDRGLTQEFKPNAWTLVTPAIKDRDFIIRFNEDGTDEFRYEVLNVTRNKLLFSLSGAQKFQLQRVDKTDMIYMWRAVRNVAKFPQVLMTSISNLAVHGPHMHEIVINEDVTAVNQINQTTAYNAGHNHVIINGVVQETLGHVHNIVLP